jgi:hypothetical protein
MRQLPGLAASQEGYGAVVVGLTDSLKRVQQRAAALVRLEAELAQLEVKKKATRLGVGIGLAAAAALLLLFAIGFAFAAGAAALALELPVWASLLIVAGAIVLFAGFLGMAALKLFKGGTPPVPERAVEEGKRTVQTLRGNGRP